MKNVPRQFPPALLAQIAEQCARGVPPEYAPLVAAMQERFGGALAALVVYGSCLRDVSIEQGIIDLYVLVTDYGSAYPGIGLRLLNRVLPPNVYYAEVAGQGGSLRVKYAVMSMQDFTAGATQWFHPYVWARFAQPVRLVYVATEAFRARVYEGLAGAVLTFLADTVPALECAEVSAEAIWSTGLSLTYRAELRPERDGQAASLVRCDLPDYERLTQCALPALRRCLEPIPGGGLRCISDRRESARVRRRWRLRRIQGRALSVLRLMKAAFTFHGGIDYAAWKIERHSGVRIEITPELRRRPILAGCKVLWKLVKRGALR